MQVHHRHISGGIERRRCRWHCCRRPLCHWDGPRRSLRHEEEERHPPHGDYHPYHPHHLELVILIVDISDHYVLCHTICCPDHLNQLDRHPYCNHHHPHGYQVKKPESPTVAFENPFYATREQAGNTAVRNND